MQPSEVSPRKPQLSDILPPPEERMPLPEVVKILMREKATPEARGRLSFQNVVPPSKYIQEAGMQSRARRVVDFTVENPTPISYVIRARGDKGKAQLLTSFAILSVMDSAWRQGLVKSVEEDYIMRQTIDDDRNKIIAKLCFEKGITTLPHHKRERRKIELEADLMLVTKLEQKFRREGQGGVHSYLTHIYEEIRSHVLTNIDPEKELTTELLVTLTQNEVVPLSPAEEAQALHIMMFDVLNTHPAYGTHSCKIEIAEYIAESGDLDRPLDKPYIPEPLLSFDDHKDAELQNMNREVDIYQRIRQARQLGMKSEEELFAGNPKKPSDLYSMAVCHLQAPLANREERSTQGKNLDLCLRRIRFDNTKHTDELDLLLDRVQFVFDRARDMNFALHNDTEEQQKIFSVRRYGEYVLLDTDPVITTPESAKKLVDRYMKYIINFHALLYAAENMMPSDFRTQYADDPRMERYKKYIETYALHAEVITTLSHHPEKLLQIIAYMRDSYTSQQISQFQYRAEEDDMWGDRPRTFAPRHGDLLKLYDGQLSLDRLADMFKAAEAYEHQWRIFMDKHDTSFVMRHHRKGGIDYNLKRLILDRFQLECVKPEWMIMLQTNDASAIAGSLEPNTTPWLLRQTIQKYIDRDCVPLIQTYIEAMQKGDYSIFNQAYPDTHLWHYLIEAIERTALECIVDTDIYALMYAEKNDDAIVKLYFDEQVQATDAHHRQRLMKERMRSEWLPMYEGMIQSNEWKVRIAFTPFETALQDALMSKAYDAHLRETQRKRDVAPPRQH